MKMAIAFATAVAFTGCGGDDGETGTDGGNGDTDGPALAACDPNASAEITITTDDGVALLADLDTPAALNGSAVILLHMIPPSNSKANFGAAFRSTLASRGHIVLNVNRRGAPGSGGVATEAYTGPSGVLDAKAAHDFLADACGGVSRLAVIGASNGTTTAADYAALASSSDDVLAPSAMVFLSGGTYTENQTSIQDNLPAFDAMRIHFAYPPGEASWNDGIAASAAAGWSFQAYTPGAHGTGLIGSNPEIVPEIGELLDAELAP